MSVLNRDQILDRLNADEIFLPTWWARENVRLAGYDLRLAQDEITIGEEHWSNGEAYGHELILEPGAVAYVSTYERFAMPWNLAANIGVRFHIARKGLLVFNGLLVDPGFGLQPDSIGGWEPKADHRLTFLLANLGERTISISLGADGEPVFSLQFFEVQEPRQKTVSPAGLPIKGTKAVDGKLSLFADVVALRKACDDLHARVAVAEAKVDKNSAATEHVVVFGVFLVSVTLLGGFCVAIIEALSSEQLVKDINSVDMTGPGAWALVALAILAAMALVGYFGLRIARAYDWIRSRVAATPSKRDIAKARRTLEGARVRGAVKTLDAAKVPGAK